MSAVIRWCSLVMLPLALFAQPKAAPGGAGPYRVGYINLSRDQDGENPATFVASLDAAPGLAASLAPARRPGDSWRAVPAEVAPSQWISLVKAKFGRQCDFFAFHFSDRAGTVLYAGRRPSRVPLERPLSPLRVAPGPDQLPGNAIHETATDFLCRLQSESTRDRPVLRIVIVPPAEGAGRAVPDETAEVMAFAAAFEAGWRPTAGPAERTLRLSLAEELGLYETAFARFEDGAPGFSRKSIPREALYAHLVRLFFRLREPSLIQEAAPLGAPGLSLLGWADGGLIVKEGRTNKAIEPASGCSLWSRVASEHEDPRFQMSSNPLVQQAEGKAEGIRFADNGQSLKALHPETSNVLWTAETGDVLLGEPVLMEGLVFAVVKSNQLRVWDARTGVVAASRTWPTWVLAAQAAKTAKGWEIACVDLDKRLSVLRPETLETVMQIAFPRPLAPGVAHGVNVPEEWALDRSQGNEGRDLIEDLGDKGIRRRPAWLVADVDGFVYAVAADQAGRK